jgi:hypothetical protein
MALIKFEKQLINKSQKNNVFFFFLIFLFCVKIFKNNGIQFNNLIMRNEKKKKKITNGKTKLTRE